MTRTLAGWSFPWWRHQMETFSALLAICAGNSPVPGEFPAQRPVTRSFDVFFDVRPNKRLSKQWQSWWFETSSCPLWYHCNADAVIWGKFRIHYSDVTWNSWRPKSPPVQQLLQLTSNKTPKLRTGNPPVTDGLLMQRVSNAERLFMSWRQWMAKFGILPLKLRVVMVPTLSSLTAP